VPHPDQTLPAVTEWVRTLKESLTVPLTMWDHWDGFAQKVEFFVPSNKKGYPNVMNVSKGGRIGWPVNEWRSYE